MSYFDYPRIHFSGQFQADPSTINNAPNNYNPTVYPEPNDLDKVELYWAPLGTSTFQFKDCVVSKVEYSPTESATTSEQDPIIGQPVISVNNGGGSKLTGGVIVDLDPSQQNVSEVWGLEIQIGNGDTMVHGQFTAISFNAIWQQGQGPGTPHSSASGSAFYQSKLTGLSIENTKNSRFLTAAQNGSDLSINMVVNAHNNKPDTYLFNDTTMLEMSYAGVSNAILEKLDPLKSMAMNRLEDGSVNTDICQPGQIPTRKFTNFIMQQFLSAEEFNECYETVYKYATLPYIGSTSCDFTWGRIYGSVAPADAGSPAYFVESRMMNQTKSSPCFFAPFKTETVAGGTAIIINLGNSLPTNTPDLGFYKSVLGTLELVAFVGGMEVENAVTLTEIDYMADGFMSKNAGFVTFVYTGDIDISNTPLGIIGDGSGSKVSLLAEDEQGYYLRANQFVYRMNPGSSDPELGENNSVDIHATKFGKPAPDGTEIYMSMKSTYEAKKYTLGTLGESGTVGVENVSVPQGALKINNLGYDEKVDCVPVRETVSKTTNGVATFNLTCTDPGNPRDYINGQVYFLNYGFNDLSIRENFTQDVNDIISVQVYDQHSKDCSVETLQKFGRIYKIMNFLTEEENIVSINYRNLISTYLNSPISSIKHMPVTRDLSLAELAEITAFIDKLNTPPPRN